LDSFRQTFGTEAEVGAFAPGRVNLIGEHTDYNEGFVLPFALPYKTVVVGSKSADKERISRVFSCNMSSDGVVSFVCDSSLGKGLPIWANYVKGTVFQYIKDLPLGFAFDAVIISDVPLGSGLSSSASLEVAVATFLESLYGVTSVSGVDKALRCRQAEHTFADTPCGIMDQYISANGRKGHLLLIDCRSQGFELIPFGGENTSANGMAGAEAGAGAGAGDRPVLLVTNSNVKHKLSGSEYPDRVKQCKRAVETIQKVNPSVRSLRDCDNIAGLNCAIQHFDFSRCPHEQLPFDPNHLRPGEDDMFAASLLPKVNAPSITEYKRARHVILEDLRTIDAVAALKRGDFAEVGRLMTESHTSLRDDFEVSCKELDILVKLALEVDGVLGSRMTGGGFGGCTITLVKIGAVAKLKAYLNKKYFEVTKTKCDCFECVPEQGATVLDLSLLQAVNDNAQSSENGSSGTSASAESSTYLRDWMLPVLLSGLIAFVAFKVLQKR